MDEREHRMLRGRVLPVSSPVYRKDNPRSSCTLDPKVSSILAEPKCHKYTWFLI
jgi:hypothetical protein